MRKLTRLVAGAAAVAVASVGLISTGAAALPPGSASEIPGTTIAPLAGSETTLFTLTPPTGAACQGDGNAGYRFHGFLAASTVDAGTLVYPNGTATLAANSGTGYVSPLFTGAGSVYGNRTPNLTNGALIGLLQLGMATFAPAPPNGSYNIGLACTLNTAGVLNTTRYWTTPITISNSTATTFSYNFGAVPAAPTGVVSTPLDARLSVQFNAVTSIPAVNAANGYTVTATPTSGTAVVQSGNGSPIVVTGLANGIAYTVTVTAANSVGTGPAATVGPNASTTPVLGTLGGVTGFSATAGTVAGTAVLAWTNPAGSNGVTIGVTGGTVAGLPITLGAGVTTLTTPVLAAGVAFTFSATATYAAGNPSPTATAGFSVIDGNVLVQDITVVRPLGALVLTQRCGVYGSAEPVSDNVFGSLPLILATPPNADPVNAATGYSYNGLPVGGIPTLGLSGAPDGTLTTGNFPQYPYPVDGNGVAAPAPSTNCGVNLSRGTLITSGPKAGQYFTATGRMNQVTVVNTKDVDTGWTLNGRMSDFTRQMGLGSFSGNLLGWNPEVTWDSVGNLDNYNMVVLPGGVREATASNNELTGLGAPVNVIKFNTSQALSLAKSNPFKAAGAVPITTDDQGSLGMAVIDARLRLLIPVTAPSGTYTGTLTLTTI